MFVVEDNNLLASYIAICTAILDYSSETINGNKWFIPLIALETVSYNINKKWLIQYPLSLLLAQMQWLKHIYL